MLAVTVEQVAAHLGGAWVQEPENTDSLIERFLIGGNILDSGETYYGRYSNQAVIVRAERPDIQLASLMEDTACLVLTGRGDPTEYIKAEAMQRNGPPDPRRAGHHPRRRVPGGAAGQGGGPQRGEGRALRGVGGTGAFGCWVRWTLCFRAGCALVPFSPFDLTESERPWNIPSDRLPMQHSIMIC